MGGLCGNFDRARGSSSDQSRNVHLVPLIALQVRLGTALSQVQRPTEGLTVKRLVLFGSSSAVEKWPFGESESGKAPRKSAACGTSLWSSATFVVVLTSHIRALLFPVLREAVTSSPSSSVGRAHGS